MSPSRWSQSRGPGGVGRGRPLCSRRRSLRTQPQAGHSSRGASDQPTSWLRALARSPRLRDGATPLPRGDRRFRAPVGAAWSWATQGAQERTEARRDAGHPRGPRPCCPSPSVPPTGPRLPALLISPGAESTSPPAADTAPEASQLLESRKHLVTVVVLKPLRRRSHQRLRHVAASEQPAASSRRP